MEDDAREPKHPEVAAIFTRLLTELQMSPAAFAGNLKDYLDKPTSQQTIQTYTSGRSKPGGKMLAAILKRFPELDAIWLMTGEGEPFPQGKYGEKKAAEPFFPTLGKPNAFGAQEAQPGELEALLGANFGEDKDGRTPPPLATDSRSFIKGLLAEIEGLKKENKQLQAVILEQRESMREQRENNQFLRTRLAELGKADGNQEYAPVSYIAAEPDVRSLYVKGLKRHDKPTDCVVVQLIPQEDLPESLSVAV